MDPCGQASALAFRAVGASIRRAVPRHEVGVVRLEPREELLAHARAQMQEDRRDVRRAGLDRRLDDGTQLVRAVGDARQHRRDQDTRRDPGIVELPDGRHPDLRAGRPRLGPAPHPFIERSDRERRRDRRDGGRLLQQVDVAQDQRSLRQDRERVPVADQLREDAPHQPVAALHPLVRVGAGPHRDVRAGPPARRELAAEHLGGVDLHDDLRLEVPPGVHLEVRVGRPREAVHAGVRAAAVGVDRPVERHRRAGDPVDDRSRLDLDAGDLPELGCVERSPADLEQVFGCHRPG